MRVVELLITESEMLLESYRDFSRIWEDYVRELRGSIQGVTISQLKTIPSRLEKLLKDNQTRAAMASAFGNRQFGDIRNIYDVGSWTSGIRSAVARDGVEDTLIEYHGAVEIIEDHTKAAILAKTPDYTTIAKTSEYIIFDVKNFSAAQKLRNQVKATWCIGASEAYFKQYGEDKDRKTLMVFFMKEKEGMVFHVDSSGGGLITSHDNQREWTVNGGNITSSRGYNHIAKELGVYLKSNELPRFMKAVGMRVRDSELVVPEEIVPEAGKLEQHVLDSFARSVRDGQYPRAYKETEVRREVISHIAQKTAPIFRRGNVFHILDDAKKLFGSLLMRDIPDNAEGVEMAADSVMCAKMIVGYLNDIQHTVVHDEAYTLIMGAQHFLNSVMDTGGRLKTTREYKDALEKSWPRVIKVINAIKEAM